MAEIIFASDSEEPPFIQFYSLAVILLIQNLMDRFYIIFKEEFSDAHQRVVHLISRRGA